MCPRWAPSTAARDTGRAWRLWDVCINLCLCVRWRGRGRQRVSLCETEEVLPFTRLEDRTRVLSPFSTISEEETGRACCQAIRCFSIFAVTLLPSTQLSVFPHQSCCLPHWWALRDDKFLLQRIKCTPPHDLTNYCWCNGPALVCVWLCLCMVSSSPGPRTSPESRRHVAQAVNLPSCRGCGRCRCDAVFHCHDSSKGSAA